MGVVVGEHCILTLTETVVLALHPTCASLGLGFWGWQQSWYDTITKHEFQIPASSADLSVTKLSRSSSEFDDTIMLNAEGT